MTRSRTLTYLVGGLAVGLLIASVTYVVIRQGDASAAADVVADAAAAPARVPIEVVPAVEGSVARVVSTSSTVEAEQAAQVLSKVAGVVTDVTVREGTFVERGQLLAEVDDEEKKLALEKAELTLKRSEAELQRAKLSYDEKLISEFDYEKAVFDRDLAEAELEAAELQLRYTGVIAPFAGTVTAKEIVVGKAIQVGDHLFTLADFRTLIARLFLPEKDVFELAPGQAVRLVPEARAGTSASTDVSFRGRVRDISPVVDPKTGTVKVTVAIVDRAADVRPGAFVRAEIETDVRENTVLVPKVAVVEEAGQDFVFVVDGATQTAERRLVELGYTRRGATEVLSGVAAGENVIVAGHTTLDDGEPVEVVAR